MDAILKAATKRQVESEKRKWKWEVGSGKWEVGSGKWEVTKILPVALLYLYQYIFFKLER